MSNVSGASSCSSNVRQRGFVVGVPRDVGVGNKSWQRIPNPTLILLGDTFDVEKQQQRTYYLVNDNHTFKWVDEALLDEVETLCVKIERVKEEMKELTIETLQDQKMKFEKMQMEFEKELCERVEEVLLEAKVELQCKMNKIIILYALVCVCVGVECELLLML
ncbi:PREDICTED: uncharacterized protein At4g04775-like [Camelina sativa]|uniref:Uncharacterized protein At4g04775-like n=1 Tax=Camelina sativa TaxID=90675 RepID=A0ABM0WBE2_CAMSA|nr:PREDICTED: uncharacterized protein At4g04775-like [Camelina sativa]